MSEETHSLTIEARPSNAPVVGYSKILPVVVCIATVLFVITYAQLFKKMYVNWNAPDSYYSHGFLIAPISIYLAWLRRKDFLAAPLSTSLLGYPIIVGSAFFLLVGAFLGFNVLGQLTFLPMIVGLSLILVGMERTKVIAFPLLFLFMMIPLPGSVTQSVTLQLKLIAAQTAVGITSLMGLPLIRDGSLIEWDGDSLLVGDVCGGLRSLIALIAIGMRMTYFSKTKPWARGLIFLMSGPIAIAANIFRIFLLCIVAYYWGSDVAAGQFHDISGVFIFAFAFVLFFALEGLLQKMAPSQEEEKEAGAA